MGATGLAVPVMENEVGGRETFPRIGMTTVMSKRSSVQKSKLQNCPLNTRGRKPLTNKGVKGRKDSKVGGGLVPETTHMSGIKFGKKKRRCTLIITRDK